jgi:hypothetical protein
MTRQARRYWRGYQAGVRATRWKYLCLGVWLALALVLAAQVLQIWEEHAARGGVTLAPGATITITPRVEEGGLEPVVIRPRCGDCTAL